MNKITMPKDARSKPRSMASRSTNGGAGTHFSERELAKTRNAIEDARHLPGHYYTSPDIYAMEIEKLFLKDWLVVGRVEEVPNPGDYLATEIVGEPIIVCRNAAGELNAFSNVCRHRGAALVPSTPPAGSAGNGHGRAPFEEVFAAQTGNVSEFRCPFHAWIYDLEGRLVAPSRGRGLPRFDAKGCRLPAIRLDTWGGFIFINFDDDCRSLSDYLADDNFAGAADWVRAEDYILIDRYTFEIDCNWKLVPENFVDAYHVEVIHKGSFATDGFGDTSLKDVIFTKWGWQKLYPSRSMSPDGEMLFGPTPWHKDHELGPKLAYSAFLRPNFNFLVRADMLQPWITYPLGVERCRVTGYTCMWKGVEKLPAFKEKVSLLKKFARDFAGEDVDLLLSTQRGLKSRRFAGGPMHYQEAAIHHRINRYLDAMQGNGDAR